MRIILAVAAALLAFAILVHVFHAILTVDWDDFLQLLVWARLSLWIAVGLAAILAYLLFHWIRGNPER